MKRTVTKLFLAIVTVAAIAFTDPVKFAGAAEICDALAVPAANQWESYYEEHSRRYWGCLLARPYRSAFYTPQGQIRDKEYYDYLMDYVSTFYSQSYCQTYNCIRQLPVVSATASSTYYPSYYGMDKVLDNNVSTYWIGGMNASPWTITIDLGANYNLDLLNLEWYGYTYNYGSYVYSYSYGSDKFDVALSVNGVNYSTVKVALDKAKRIQLEGQGRFIKVTMKKAIMGAYPVLSEVKVFGRRVN